MAKTNGPLFSMDASGKFGGALVFSKWKGRPTVRQLVRPSNPKTQGQAYARNYIRLTAAMQRTVNLSTAYAPGQSTTDKIRWRNAAPSGQAWNGYLVKSTLGLATMNYFAAKAAYDALTAPQMAAWQAANDALVTKFSPVIFNAAGNVFFSTVPSGEVFFIYVYGLFKAGLSTEPGPVPPAYV